MDVNAAMQGGRPSGTRLTLGSSIFKILYNLFNLFMMAIIIFSFVYNVVQTNNETHELEIRGLTETNRKIEKVFHVLSGLYEKLDKQDKKVDTLMATCAVHVEPIQESPVEHKEDSKDEDRLAKIEKSLNYLIQKEKKAMLDELQL